MDGETVGTASQSKAEELAEHCLRSATHPALKNVTCDYANGVLVLRGRIPTYYLKQLAQAAVAQLEAVERMDNQIEVISSVR